MPVEKLFWDDPYLTDCDARVTSTDGALVRLDRTVAYAFSGGQASDTGRIGGYPILLAETVGRDIAYTVPHGHHLVPGSRVRVAIDWPNRYRIMRLHFAAELVLETVTRLLDGPEKIGANISADKARVDFAHGESLASELPAIEREIARIVAEDLPIVSAFSDERAQRRYWEVDGFARVACGGTHLRRTGEVGALRLRRSNPGAGKERIEITLVDPNAGLGA